MAEPDIRILVKTPDIVGENPLWHPVQRRLYWTDNRARCVYRIDPVTLAIERVVEGYAVYAFTLQRNDDLLLFLDHTRIAVAREGEVQIVGDGLTGETESRFNDVIADFNGRVLAGIVPLQMGTRSGSLYGIERDGTARCLRRDIGMPNGMGFSPDGRMLYLADTFGKRILRYDYDIATGNLSNDGVFADFTHLDNAMPDGLTVDAEGCLWVALAGGWVAVRLNSAGREVGRIRLPARKVTSASFGGDRLDTLYITSACLSSSPSEEIGSEAGALFSAGPVATGRLDSRSDLRIPPEAR